MVFCCLQGEELDIRDLIVVNNIEKKSRQINWTIAVLFCSCFVLLFLLLVVRGLEAMLAG